MQFSLAAFSLLSLVQSGPELAMSATGQKRTSRIDDAVVRYGVEVDDAIAIAEQVDV